jgi:regulator of sigma E protease
MDIDRNGQPLQVTVRIPPGQTIIGVHIGQRVPFVRVGPIRAGKHAVDSNVRILRLTAKALGQVFQGKRSVRNTLSGPIGIARESSRVVSELGWAGIFTMLAFLSLNLGVFNLLPIPVLDGGAIFLLLAEGALGLVGMTISMRVRERIQQVGFVVVILLMVFVITNDIIKQVAITRGNSGASPPAASPAQTSPGK